MFRLVKTLNNSSMSPDAEYLPFTDLRNVLIGAPMAFNGGVLQRVTPKTIPTHIALEDAADAKNSMIKCYAIDSNMLFLADYAGDTPKIGSVLGTCSVSSNNDALMKNSDGVFIAVGIHDHPERVYAKLNPTLT